MTTQLFPPCTLLFHHPSLSHPLFCISGNLSLTYTSTYFPFLYPLNACISLRFILPFFPSSTFTPLHFPYIPILSLHCLTFPYFLILPFFPSFPPHPFLPYLSYYLSLPFHTFLTYIASPCLHILSLPSPSFLPYPSRPYPLLTFHPLPFYCFHSFLFFPSPFIFPRSISSITLNFLQSLSSTASSHLVRLIPFLSSPSLPETSFPL